jgi:hypothetical protein
VKDNRGLDISDMYCILCEYGGQTGHTTGIKYREHAKQSSSRHTNLMMAEHSTNAKFYIPSKVPMTLTVNNTSEGSLVK